MQLLIIRHARAEERGLLRRDAGRRLTKDGRKEMRKAAKGLARLVDDLDILATSPLTRAHETADILADELDGPAPTELQLLAPRGSPGRLLAWVADQPADATVALIGHEPDLGCFAGYLLGGKASSFIELKKGAACLISFEREPKAGEGRLQWLLTPSQLRKLGR
jgi:phosphohistidine phosphatase